MAQGEDEVRRIWKEYLEDLYNIYTQEQVAVHVLALTGFGDETTSEESQLEELRVK